MKIDTINLDINCKHCGHHIGQFANFAYPVKDDWRSTGGILYCKYCFQNTTFDDAVYAHELRMTEDAAYMAVIRSYEQLPVLGHD